MKPAIVAEKLLALGLAGLLVTGLHWRSVITVMIVLGQGHFLLAYYYQARARKITPRYLLNYLFWAAVIVAVYWSHPFPSGLVAVATIYFAWHMAVDEFYLTELPLKLRESPLHLGRLLEMVPLIVVYAAAVADAVLAHGAWPQFPALLGFSLQFTLLALFAYVALIGLRGYRPDWRSCYFLLAGGLLDVSAKFGWLQLVPAPKLSGFIILFHYFSWYLHYYLSLPLARKLPYVGQVVLVNLMVVGCFLLVGKEGPGWFFFQESNFYLWTLMHLISSTRWGDVRALWKWP